jgi:hypothetical protein
MRPSVLSALALTAACDLTFFAAGSLGQQPSTSAASGASRRGYYSRVQTQAAGSSRLDVSRSRYASGRAAFASNAYQGEADPLRPYGQRATSGSGDVTRPYERAPVVSPPQRQMPAPEVSHNYYPGLRSGQSVNRNVGGSHCVPGRNSFLHR